MNAEDRFAIADVMTSYGSGLDDSDMERYRNCFADDVIVVGLGPSTIEGADNWINFVNQAMTPYSATQHFMGPQLVELEGDIAHVRTDLQAIHFYKDGPDTSLTLWGTYFTDMIRTDAGWKIKRHEMVRRGMQKV